MSYSKPNQSRRFQKRPREDREMFDVTCSNCGNAAQVPFKPDGERPVFCQTCYANNRPNRR